MPEIKNTFTSGRMNKDLDERLLPKGEYRNALNIDIATSETGNMGTAQNVMGNEQVSTLGITGQQCIGSIADTKNDKIYWFVSGTSVDAIVEYNTITRAITPILVDTNKGASSAILNFTTDNQNTSNKNLISGVNLIVDEDDGGDTTSFLLWTDNKSEPKKINIERCKTGSINYSTMTRLFIDGDDRGDILEEHITVIKKLPLNAPNLALYKTEDESRDQTLSMSAQFTSAHGDFTLQEAVVVGSSGTSTDVVTRVKGDRLTGPCNSGGCGMRFYSNTRLMYQAGDIIKLTASTFDTGLSETYTVRVSLLLLIDEGADFQTFNAEIVSISSDLTQGILVWECELEQGDSLFELIFPRFGYRWKYVDGEYSCFSPFSKVAFLPDPENGFEYSPVDAYNVAMINHVKAIRIAGGTILPFDTRPSDVVEVDILYKESNTTNVYTITTLKTKEEMDIVESGGDGFQIESEQVHAVVPSNQLLRSWDNVPRKTKAQEITKNRIIYGNYLQNFDIPEDPSFVITPSTHAVDDVIGTESLKSIRNYQVGVVFIDKYGRQSPVLSNNTGAIRLDQSFAETSNQLNVQIVNSSTNALAKPIWATHYRYFIKEPSLEYYNLAMDRFYVQDQEQHVWISFASAERNKVDEESYLILKKQHESDVSVETAVGMTYKYKVIDIKNEAPDSIRKRKKLVGTISTQFGQTEADTGFGFPEKDAMYFKVPHATIKDTALEFIDTENPAELYARIKGTRSESVYYQLTAISTVNILPPGSKSTTTDGYWIFRLEKPFGSDIDFTLDTNGNEVSSLSLSIYKEEILDLPEFDGRFFVKIKRDDVLDTNLLNNPARPKYGKLYSAYLFHIDYIKSDALIRKDSLTPTYYKNAVGDNLPALRQRGRASKAMYESKEATDNKVKIDTQVFSIDNAVYYDKDATTGATGSNPHGVGRTDTDFNAMRDRSNKFTIRLTNCGSEGQYATKNPTLEMFRNEDEYNFHIALTQNGTIFRFKDDPNETVHEIIQTDREIVYNWLSGPKTFQPKWRLKPRHKKMKENHGLRYTITTKEHKVPGRSPLGWTPLSFDGHSEGTAPIDQAGTKWGGHSMAFKVNAGFGAEIEIVKEIFNELTFSSRNPAIWETEPKPTTDLDLYYETGKTYPIADLGNEDTIEYSNCWSFGNGAESNRIRDDYNAVYVDKGPRVSSVLAEQYKEERRSSGLIYSGIYNSSSGFNRLNQFIQAEKITKDVNPEYGSIQKLFTRDSDVLVLCEDKCLKVYANKDALFNADGSTNLLATHRVLGVSQPFIGDYGISTNPESFATFGFRSYFTDKRRGAVLRLSRDGLTNIAYKGMRDWFSDNLRQPSTIIGNYDDKKDNYNISLIGSSTTALSFTELTGGWTSFKSFIPESGLTLNNTYYTFYNGDLWEHNTNSLRNNFYGIQYNSTIKLIFNDAPSSIKNFKTLNYEGTTSRLYQTVDRGFTAGSDTTVDLEGWYCNSITTGEQDGDVPYFINKEGKWFGNLHGSAITTTDLQSAEAAKEFKVQGIGNCSTCTGASRSGYYLKINPVIDASDDISDNNFAVPTEFVISGVTYNNTTNIKTYNNGVTVATNAIFTFEPNDADTGNASVMRAADFSFVSESSSIVTDAVTDASVAFEDTTSAYATDNKVTMTVPLLFQVAGNDQTIELRITGATKYIRSVSGKWYSTVEKTSVPSSSNTSGTAYSASGVVGTTAIIDLDPSDSGVTTTTFTADTDYIFKSLNHPFIDLTGCYIAGSNYRVTETPVFGSTGDISSKVFALTYKIPDYNVTDDIINFYATSQSNATASNDRITNFSIDGKGVNETTTTITTGASSATHTVEDTDGLHNGMLVTGNGVPFGSAIIVNSITSSTVLVLSESIITTANDTYTFTTPTIINQAGEIDKSLKVYGDAGAVFDLYLVKDSDDSSLLTDSGGATVSSIRGTIPAAGGLAYYEELLDFPPITSGNATYTLTLEEVTGTSRFVSPLTTPEKVKFVQYIDCTVTLLASESSSVFSLSVTTLGTSTGTALNEPHPLSTIELSTVLTSSTADANFILKDTIDSDGDGVVDAFDHADWSYRDTDNDNGIITLSNGTRLTFEDLDITLNNTLSNATATLSGTAYIHEYGSTNDSSTLNFDNLLGFEVSSNPGLIGTSVGTGIYDIPITVGTAAGQFEVAFNAGNIADRFQILFDSGGLSNDIDDMEVVADSLHVGDYLHVAGTGTNSRGEFRAGAGGYVGAIGSHAGIKKYLFVGTGGDSSLGYSMGGFWDDNGTTTVTITAADIAGPDSDTPNSDVRHTTTNYGDQVGLTNYYYDSASDFIAGTKQTHNGSSIIIYSDDGHATLIYNKSATTSTRAYIRCRSYSGHNSSTTGWFIYGTRFTAT